MANTDIAPDFRPVRIALLTVSDTRDLATDTSGQILADRITADRHRLTDRQICRDEISEITARLNAWIDGGDVDVIITTGGTGVTGRDVTPEALAALGGRDIPGFGELFRWISFGKIGTSTIQSRACAVVCRGTFVFALPGSSGAVKDGWDEILRSQLDSRHKPCNFVELMPRLTE